MRQLRQGDVLLVKVGALPVGAKDITPTEGRGVLKHGEATGHAHAIKERTKVRLWDAGAERFLQVLESVALRHEEHAPVMLEPGIYHLPEQVEWTDDNEPIRVAD